MITDLNGVVVAALLTGLVVLAVIASLVDTLRERRVPTQVRVAQLREALRHVEPGAEVLIRPAASWSLSVEMITKVARDEGCRFVRDTTTSINNTTYEAMVFTAQGRAG